MWTQFWDMHSGGGTKLDWEMIYIEAPEEEAIKVFYSKFGRNPERVSCTCCGPDYSISEGEDLSQITGFHRGCVTIQEKWDESSKKWVNPGKVYFEKGEGIPRGWEAQGSFVKDYKTLEEYLNQDDIKVIYASEIAEDEKNVEVPPEGYVWL